MAQIALVNRLADRLGLRVDEASTHAVDDEDPGEADEEVDEATEEAT